MSDLCQQVYIEHTDVGATLTTWVYTSFWQLYAAEKTGRAGYINWPKDRLRALAPYWDEAKFAEKPNMYDWYFEQPLFNAPPLREEVWCWTDTKNAAMAKAMGEHCPYGALAPLKAFYQQHLRFNADVQARGAALVAKYGLDFNKLIGVTWRGTDCVTDGRPLLPIEVYFPFLDEILTKEPGLRIMATAEEEHVLDPLLARYPEAFRLKEFYASPRGHRENPERFSPFSGFERGMQPALMVWLFSQCKHYVKNRSSVAAVASWLSKGRIVSLAHPENLGHGFDITKAEVEGQIVPLYR